MNDRLVIAILTVLVLMCGVDTVVAVHLLANNPDAELNPVNRWLINFDNTMAVFVAAKWVSTMSSVGFILIVRSWRKHLGRAAAFSAVAIMLSVLVFAVL